MGDVVHTRLSISLILLFCVSACGVFFEGGGGLVRPPALNWHLLKDVVVSEVAQVRLLKLLFLATEKGYNWEIRRGEGGRNEIICIRG